ncbi:MAG TPA: histidine phosphatase family protein [Tepidisphaeraceae bacterium]|nr:histidine phosphatase family protein [Tepidisphaeraceae bacterium]
MKHLILVRHGQSDQQVHDLTGGWTDTPLTDLGHRQAVATAQRLAEMFQGERVSLYSSDLARAADTAKIIGQALTIEPICRAELREMNNGQAAGLTRAQAKTIELPVTQPIADWQPYPNAESWRLMNDRMFRAMGNIDRETDQTAILVTHANSGVAVIAWWLGLTHAWEKRISFQLDACGISRLGINRWGEKTIVKLNDTSHLESLRRQHDRAPQGDREISRRLLATGQFINLQTIQWRDAQGRPRLWESAERVNGTPAVMLIAWLVPSNRLVLIRQFRPPAKGTVVEFPAGLIDPNETAEAAALRELREETGYHARVLDIGQPAFNTPGLSPDAAHPVLLEIDERDPANHNPLPHPGDEEEIQVLLIPRDALGDFVRREIAEGRQFDSKVLAYLAGLMG